MKCFPFQLTERNPQPDKPIGSDSSRQPVSGWVCPLDFRYLPLPCVLITPPGFGPYSLLTKFLFSPFLWFYVQLEAFYSIFTTEQQDHVKSVEYLRNNFRPQQDLNNRVVYKSAVRDAWNHDMTDFLENPLGTEASKGTFGFSALAQRKISLS